MKRLVAILMILAFASCKTAKVMHQNKIDFPLGHLVYYQNMYWGIGIKSKAWVVGYNHNGTIRIFAPIIYISESGRILFKDSVLISMDIKPDELKK